LHELDERAHLIEVSDLRSTLIQHRPHTVYPVFQPAEGDGGGARDSNNSPSNKERTDCVALAYFDLQIGRAKLTVRRKKFH
jgi:hypothetical protein